jgi:predicted metal-dependent peptidase
VNLDQHKVAAARVWAAARMPYLAHALFAAQVREAPDSGTVAIDAGWTVSADPEIVEGLEAPDLGRLLLHLISHPLREHADRADRNAVEQHTWWNRCADAEINDDLLVVDALPPTARDLPADLGGAENQLAESYYGQPVVGERRWDCGSGADGQDRPWDGPPGLSPGQGDLLRSRTAADVQEANQQQPGSVPAGLLRWAEALLPSKVDWRRVLAAEVRQALAAISGSVDYTYRRPSRRGAAARPALLPSLFRPLPRVAVVCDTSGSMHAQLLERALAEIENLLTRAGLRAAQLQVLAVDTEVHSSRRVTSARQVALLGGGGTDMGAGIDAAVRLRPRPSLVIVLTDGYTPWPADPPKGVRLIIGLLIDPGMGEAPKPPDYARVVVIDDD